MPLPDDIPGLGRKTDCPRPNPSTDIRDVNLNPIQGFVLSRVDGASSYESICQITGLGDDQTVEILRFLKDGKLILGPNEAVPFSTTRAQARTPFVGVPTVPPSHSLLERLDDGSAIDPAELVGGADLSYEQKTRILRTHRRLRNLTPFELLGLEKGADVNVIRRSYFAASKELHPDRFYGKEIGPFRDKLNDIFARVTEAFEALNKDLRDERDKPPPKKR